MMSDPIELLKERDDVVKTEYKRISADEGRVAVEMWHDAESLQKVVQDVMDNPSVSERGIKETAKDSALAVRETTTSFKAMYPKVLSEFRDERNS